MPLAARLAAQSAVPLAARLVAQSAVSLAVKSVMLLAVQTFAVLALSSSSLESAKWV